MIFYRRIFEVNSLVFRPGKVFFADVLMEDFPFVIRAIDAGCEVPCLYGMPLLCHQEQGSYRRKVGEVSSGN